MQTKVNGNEKYSLEKNDNINIRERHEIDSRWITKYEGKEKEQETPLNFEKLLAFIAVNWYWNWFKATLMFLRSPFPILNYFKPWTIMY